MRNDGFLHTNTTMANDNLGPLPESDRADELEDLSARALSGVLPVEKFRLRNEPGKDRGADRYIEAKFDGHDTNCRAQVQLKGTDSTKANADGSMSRKVAVSNLNYLCFGPSPIYVLYVVPTDKLLFLWAREEVARLDRENLDWRTQHEVTLRFTRRLDAATLEEIHARVVQEARFERQLHEILARSTVAERV